MVYAQLVNSIFNLNLGEMRDDLIERIVTLGRYCTDQ